MAELSFDHFFNQVQNQTAEEFVAARKRLREARARWIEENECPTAYTVTSKDANGKEVAFATPFQIGKLKYEGEYPDTPIPPRVHEDKQLEGELLDGVEAVLAEAAKHDAGTQIVSMKAGEEVNSFIMGSADQSPHPPILEGEDYGEYVARVSGTYQKQVSSRGGAGSSVDGVRTTWRNDDSPGAGRSDGPGAGNRGQAGSRVGHDAQPVRALDPGNTIAACNKLWRQWSENLQLSTGRGGTSATPSPDEPDDAA